MYGVLGSGCDVFGARALSMLGSLLRHGTTDLRQALQSQHIRAFNLPYGRVPPERLRPHLHGLSSDLKARARAIYELLDGMDWLPSIDPDPAPEASPVQLLQARARGWKEWRRERRLTCPLPTAAGDVPAADCPSPC